MFYPEFQGIKNPGYAIIVQEESIVHRGIAFLVKSPG